MSRNSSFSFRCYGGQPRWIGGFAIVLLKGGPNNLDSPLQVEGKDLTSIEVDFGNRKPNEFADKQVKIVGSLEKHQRGVAERKECFVIIVDEIQRVKN